MYVLPKTMQNQADNTGIRHLNEYISINTAYANSDYMPKPICKAFSGKKMYFIYMKAVKGPILLYNYFILNV